MKTATTDNPVRLGWLREQGLRLDAGPYLSGAFAARQLLKRLPVRKDPLAKLTAGHNGGIFNGPKFSRLYVNDPDVGVPFLGSTDMMEADLTHLPLLGDEVAHKIPYLEIQPGMTLISCSGTIGRMSYVRSDMRGIWSSQHVMKVQADPDRVKSGYLNTFLRSRYGVPIIASQAYGAIIQHIEPHHIADLPVPRFGEDVESRIHDLVEEAASLRAEFQSGVQEATRDLFTTAGLEELLDVRWHQQPRDLGFAQRGLTSTSLRALNYQPRARRIIDRLFKVDHVLLGDICRGGQLSRGVRFVRVDGAADSRFSYQLVGQRQSFWLRPEGRWVSKGKTPKEVLAEDATILVAARGTLGENEVYGRPVFATGSWCQKAFSEDFLRIRSGDLNFSGAYLFAFIRSEALFRVLRSLSTGGKQQDIHTGLCAEIPVPVLSVADRNRITETVRAAYRKRDEADVKEDRALALLEKAIEEHAGVTGE
ncbi:restriction endonuclease subunit S [Streptomyces sp. ICN988]|uniref:methylation-associated defense system restriction endonuclease subunit S MAD5 n=1 Tax=Streptomyces sp. ICN988 TaxID=2983765 RepID=UPI0021E40907|nr:restriction endonuclease subunit S [Streptomyces sp. ICN988]MCV2459431.1 restriction endonuclease subunit S [Streptomyces sp. ICN988]